MPKIEELILQIKNSEILLPEFQRGYVWTNDQVRTFVRSLYREHPTGHLLIWKTHKPPKTRGRETARDSHSLLLLDGQQRLTTLFALFEGKPPPFYEEEELFFNLYFNIQTEEFRFWQKMLMEGDPTWISVHGFLEEGIHKLIARLPQLDERTRQIYQENLERLSKLDAVRNYIYEIDQLFGEELAVDEVVEIFNRVNSAGTPLTKADLAVAHVCSVWPEAREEMRKFGKEMGEFGFPVDLTFLVRCIAAVAADSLLLEGSFYRLPAEELQLAWKKVASSFQHLVNVLRHEAFADRMRDLPTPNALIPMTVYLARNGESFPNDRVKARFIRWMHLAGLWGRYSGSTDTKLQKDVAALEGIDPVDRLVDAILADRGRIRLEAKDLEGKGAGTAVYKFSYVVARARGAKDWFEGLMLYNQAAGESNGLESHHIFPKAVLRKAGYTSTDHRRLVNEVANRAFLTRRANKAISAKQPADYLPEVPYPRGLRAQAVPMRKTLWSVENFEKFLAARRQLLATAMNTFLDELEPSGGEDIDEASEIHHLVQESESQWIEYKSSLRTDLRNQGIPREEIERMCVKSVAGFLNSKDGGRLVIGVADDRTVLGLAEDYASFSDDDRAARDRFEVHLTNLITGHLGESVMAFITITMHDVDGNDVCQVTVEPSDHPIYYQRKNETTFYLRTGASTKPLPLEEVVSYVGSRWGQSG